MAVQIVLPLIIFSQNNIYKEEYNINTYIKPSKISFSKNRIACSEGFVYSISKDGALEGDELAIKKFNTKTKSTTIQKIKKEKLNKSLFSEIIEDFELAGEKLVILTDQSIYIFNSDKLQIEHVLKNEKSFNVLHKLNSKEILLLVNYNFHPLDAEDTQIWGKLNIETTTVSNYKKMGEENRVFTYFVNEWTSVYNGLIATSLTTDYTIRFYNTDFNPVDSIKSDLLNSNKPLLKYIPDGNGHSADEMHLIRTTEDTLLTRIEKIFLLDSSNLLVVLKQPKIKYMRVDIWHKGINGWTINKTGQLQTYYQVGQKYDSGNNAVSGFYGNIDGLIYAGNKEFYFFYFPFKENVITESYDIKKDYDEIINELTREKKLYYGVKKLRIL